MSGRGASAQLLGGIYIYIYMGRAGQKSVAVHEQWAASPSVWGESGGKAFVGFEVGSDRTSSFELCGLFPLCGTLLLGRSQLGSAVVAEGRALLRHTVVLASYQQAHSADHGGGPDRKAVVENPLPSWAWKAEPLAEELK